ncbi:MAG: flagellar type III secretion system pore protein FliP [Desulfosoma sp.]|uniref:flagellar type III secretion system pore protein FliP n=1 Tax=Desulfosoma sp. TaxID=2603217 RepID=UPI004049C1BB
MRLRKAIFLHALIVIALTATLWSPQGAWSADFSLPAFRLHWDEPLAPEQVSSVLKIVFVLTVISIAPSILLLMTCFTRIAVVLSFLRTAMGTQQAPPNQVIVGLALFLTFSIMWPVWQEIHREAVVPLQNQAIDADTFVQRAVDPLKAFMMKQTRLRDLKLFVSLTQQEKPQNPKDVPLAALVPAFVISELKTAFQIGFLLYIPFLVLDMVVASVLLSMGMMMLPPVMISLPFKLMLFVLVDGWNLLIGSLVKSFS